MTRLSALAVLAVPIVLGQTTAPIPGYQPVSGSVASRSYVWNGSAWVAMTQPGGGGGGSATEYTEDVAPPADPVAGALSLRRRDSLSSETTTDGDWTTANATAKGELYVKHADPIACTQSGSWTGVGVTGTFWQATQPVSGPLTDAQFRASAVSVDSVEAFALDTTAVAIRDRLPSALVGGRLDENLGAWLGSTAPTVGQKTMANAVPVSIASDQTPVPVSGTITANQGGAPWSVSLSQTGTNNDTDALCTQGGTWTVQPGNTANSTAWLFKLSQTSSDNDVDVLTLPSVTIGVFPDNEPFNLAQVGGTSTVSGGVNGTLGVGGPAANAAVMTGNPVPLGAYVEADAAGLDSTNEAEGDVSRLKSDPEGRLLVATGHPNRFFCTMSSTATTSTSVTGCAAPGAGLSRYLTDIYISNSALTGTNPATLQYGTGTNCATGTTVVFRCLSIASDTCGGSFVTPIKEGANVDTCFLSATAGTKTIQIQGYIAP